VNEIIRSIAKQCSQPKGSVDKEAIFHLRPYIESYLESTWLQNELEQYENWASKNSDPVLQRSFLHRPLGLNMLAASIWVARDWEVIHKGDHSFELPAGARRLLNIACSLAVLEYHAGQFLDRKAREHLRQRLQAPGQEWGIIHELQTFARFVREGAEVQPHFLGKASSQEMMLHWRGVDIPVQCKNKPPGSGRVISQEAFTTLAGCIARDARVSGKRLLVRIGSTGKIRPEDIDFLRHQVSNGVGSVMGPALVTHEGRTFTVRSQPLSGRFTSSSLQNYLLGFAFHLSMVIGEPGRGDTAYDAMAVVGIEANPQERPWNSLRRSIIDGARQLKNGPPGIVAIYYADPVEDFEALRPAGEPMKVYIGQLLDSHPHVGAVLIASEPNLQLPQTTGSGRVAVYYRKPWPFPNGFLLNELS
jgi:hypothetical protein